MELWKEVRQRVLTGEISQRAALRQYHLGWRTLKKILTHDAPPGYRQSQPTLSRFENAVTIADLKRLGEALLQEFLDSFAAPPVRITQDVDAFDDPTHGQQRLFLSLP